MECPPFGYAQVHHPPEHRARQSRGSTLARLAIRGGPPHIPTLATHRYTPFTPLIAERCQRVPQILHDYNLDSSSDDLDQPTPGRPPSTTQTNMPRAFHVPAVAFLFIAFALLFLVSISLPYLTGIDIVRTTFAGPSSAAAAPQGALRELRVSDPISYTLPRAVQSRPR